MKSTIPPTVQNRLVSALPRRERERFLADCVITPVQFGQVLCDADATLAHAYFPLDGFVSLFVAVVGHRPMEVGLIGDEGMLGAHVALGIARPQLLGMVQGGGQSLRITAALLRRHLAPGSALLRLVLRYVHVQLTQQARLVACTQFHETEARLSRWLLMSHDRAHADDFHLTHQFLGDMLGVQRGAVTLAAGDLQRRGLIRYTRGNIEVLSRSGLEQASCSCYTAMRRDYTLQFPG